MYDNIDLVLKADRYPGDLIQDTPQYLTQVTNQGENQHGQYISGYLESLKVSITENRVRIYNSSLCKYFLGDNFKTLTKSNTRGAIQKISDSLHLPFNKAEVTRIDFAQNLIVKKDEKAYYRCLGQAQYYSRLEQNNGLYYNNQLRQLLFYGKEYEQKIKRQQVPELYRNRHVLRFEMRFRKRLSHQFRRPELSGETLYDEVFYRQLVERWKNEYLAIQKINAKLNKMTPTGSKIELVEKLAHMAIVELGQPQLLDALKEWQKSGEITKKQGYDLRGAVRTICSKQMTEEGNDLIEELNKKIKEAARMA